MADEADQAQIVTEAHLERCIAAARGIVLPERESADNCIECGEQIPSARQIAVPGCQLCVECAAVAEQRRALGMRP